MTEVITLSGLCVGEAMYVFSVGGEPDMIQRLKDLGIVENTVVRCVMVSPLGDPKAYDVRGAVIALRSDDAKGILGVRAGDGEVCDDR